MKKLREGMWRKWAVLFGVFLFIMIHTTSSTVSASEIFRVQNSPYPASNQAVETLFVLVDSDYSSDELLCIQSLQGNLAQNQPQIYHISNSGMQLWISDLEQNYWMDVDQSLLHSNLSSVLQRFSAQTSAGYLLADNSAVSTNVALSLCGITPNTIVITPSLQSQVEQLGISQFLDVRHKNLHWLWENYSGKFSSTVMIYQEPDKSMVAPSDYGVFSRAVMLNESTHNIEANQVIRSLRNNSALLGWGTSEQGLVSWASRHAVMVNAADWAVDLSVLTNLALAPTFFPLQQKTLPQTPIGDCAVQTVCFLMSDGDNIQWILNSLAVDSDWWASPDRGQVPISWTISPALVDLAPSVLEYFFRTASANATSMGSDYFVAAPSGTGYNYPDLYSNVQGFAALSSAYMLQSDLSLLNIIADSPPDDTDSSAFTSQANIDGIFWYLYSNYAGLNGSISWQNGKPIIGARYMLWDGFETPSSLAEKLNGSTMDCSVEAGYSLVVVHVWDQTVSDVVDCVSMLNSNVKVVQADQFVKRISSFLSPT